MDKRSSVPWSCCSRHFAGPCGHVGYERALVDNATMSSNASNSIYQTDCADAMQSWVRRRLALPEGALLITLGALLAITALVGRLVQTATTDSIEKNDNLDAEKSIMRIF
jgi:hypothetical protein